MYNLSTPTKTQLLSTKLHFRWYFWPQQHHFRLLAVSKTSHYRQDKLAAVTKGWQWEHHPFSFADNNLLCLFLACNYNRQTSNI